jgi:hypothetical protein
MYNGQLLILRDSKTYNVMGVEVGEQSHIEIYYILAQFLVN